MYREYPIPSKYGLVDPAQVLELDTSVSSERDDFLDAAGLYLKIAGVTDTKSTLRLAGEFFDFSPEFAKGTLRCAGLVLDAVDVLDRFDLGTPVNRKLAVQGALLADIGKESVGQSLVLKSVEGQEWTRADQNAMKSHVNHSFNMALDAGEVEVAPILAEHHGAQAEPYGVGINLDDAQHVARDIVHAADFFEASTGRSNSRNRGLGIGEILCQDFCHLERHTFSNPLYDGKGPEIVSALITRFSNSQ